MAMAGKIKLSFPGRVFLLMIGATLVMGIAFATWGFHRERQFKIEMLNLELQYYNRRILYNMKRGIDIQSIVENTNKPREDVQVSLIDSAGHLTYNNVALKSMHDVANDAEIREARIKGNAYTATRHNPEDKRDYFYSATQGPYGLVVRSAVPYDTDLLEMLKVEIGFFEIVFCVMLLISIIGWYVTRKISRSINRLNRFAEKAENGERIYGDAYFPDDELGSISSHIVRLYSRLQQVMAERDLQHAEALKAVKDKERFKKQLTTDINHELKTPVASIILCLETLRDFPDMPQQHKDELLKRLMNNASRLQDMLKDVSIITRMDEGSQMIHLTPLSLNEIIDDVVSDLTPAAARKDIDIVCDYPDDIEISGNRPMLESIFRNLINNSILYSGCDTITVKGDAQGNWSISDNGCGIPAKHHPHIFDRFYRLEPGRSRKAGGTGLGLAIVRGAVELHGGKIRIESGNPGVIFAFTLPRDDSQ